MYCVGGSLKNLCRIEMRGGGWGGLSNADVIRGGGGRSMLKVAVKFAKILLTSYVNAP